MRALDLRGFRSEGFLKKQKKTKKKQKKQKKTEKNKKKQKNAKKCKKEKKRAKMSKKQHDFWLVCCGQERLFIFMLFCSWVGGVGACQLFRPCCHHCLIVNCCQVLLTVTWSARTDWNDSTH